MGNHWPLVVAAGIIALAVGLGIYQHDRAAAAALASAPPAQQTPASVAPKAAPAPVAQPPQAPAAVKPAVLPAAVRPPAEETPAQPAPAEKPDFGTGRPFRPAAQPAAPVFPVPAAKRDPNAQMLQDLRTLFQEKLKVVPKDLAAAGSFAFSLEGARVEVQPWPQWSVDIYNFNRNAPEQETESFKSCLEIVATALKIDMTQPAVKTETGKSFMKSMCSLGAVSLVRDPAINNSCRIRPIQANAIVPLQQRPKPGDQIIAPKPAAPKPPPPTPVTPPRPPQKDDVF